jgi:hypothetical protein
MGRDGLRCAMPVVVALFAALFAAQPRAQSGGGYEIVKSTIDGGGGSSVGSPYVLHSTIGQPDARYSEGGSFTLAGGFWGSHSNPLDDEIFHNGFD